VPVDGSLIRVRQLSEIGDVVVTLRICECRKQDSGLWMVAEDVPDDTSLRTGLVGTVFVVNP
jgi:hypothetical protein